MRIALAAASVFLLCFGTASAEQTLVHDSFDRADADEKKDGPGGGWGTNSRSRAAGNKQVWLRDGAMYIERHPVADHGVSVTHEAAFKDAVITLRFKLPSEVKANGRKGGGDLGLNIADMNEKSVHAGHICMARISPRRVELVDLKTGNMRLDLRTKRQAGEPMSAEEKALIASKKQTEQVKLQPDMWHDLKLTIEGETMTLVIDGDEVAAFASEGIGHATKSRLRIAVNNAAWVDDVKIVRTDG